MLITLAYAALFWRLSSTRRSSGGCGTPRRSAKVVASIGLMLSLAGARHHPLRHRGPIRPSSWVLPTETVTLFGATVSRDLFLPLAGIVVSAVLPAGGGLPIDALRHRDASGGAERARRCGCSAGGRCVRRWANWAIASTPSPASPGSWPRRLRPSPRRHFDARLVPSDPRLRSSPTCCWLTVAALAGLLIGVGQSLCVKAATTWTWFPQHGRPVRCSRSS